MQVEAVDRADVALVALDTRIQTALADYQRPFAAAVDDSVKGSAVLWASRPTGLMPVSDWDIQGKDPDPPT